MPSSRKKFKSEHSPPLRSTIPLSPKTQRPNCEILRLLTRSGFVSVQGLGRLLLCISKSMTNSIYTNDEVWKLLMRSRFKLDITISPTSIFSQSLKEIFHSLQKKEVCRPSPPIRPLKFCSRDYTLIANLYYIDSSENRHAIFTKFIDGHTIPNFFHYGIFELDLNADPPYYDFANLSLSIHMMRSDGKSCCLLGSKIGEEMDENQIWFGYNSLEMNEVSYANILWQNLPSSSDYSFLDIMEDIGFLAHLDLDHDIPSRQEEEHGCFSLDMVSFRKISIEAVFSMPHEYVPFIAMNENSDETSFPTQITFAHFLEEFYAWYC